ncbi:MAG TPA: PaaI family thioesterase [Blastococcus sp.]|nr:PaaI family thioesterase [Blastococcus sp.]
MSVDESTDGPVLRGPEGLADAGLIASRQRRTAAEPTPEFLAMIDALRTLQDDVTAAAPPPDVVAAAAQTLEELSQGLRPYAVPERQQVTGHLSTIPGRGQTMAPVLHVDEWGETFARGRVTFGRFYLGGNGAVHGGVIPLVFDEILGRLANTGGRTPSRTAYLHVNYRSITPVGAELRFEGRFDREEGRKRFLVGTLHDGDTLCADADGLFVALKPGQP